MNSQPLAGIRVISLAEQYPGPYATLLLADLGADVILVERPGHGDPTRQHPGLFCSLNRNKRSVTLDLKSTEGHEAFLRLVDSADVVIEGFRPGVMKRLRLDDQALQARKPGLVCVSISAFGQTGPMASLAGHDLSIQAAVGMVEVPPGAEATTPLPRLPMADIAAAMFAAFGVVVALFDRARDGGGKAGVVDVSMFDALVSWMTPFIVPPLNDWPVRPLPPLDPGYGVFATQDGGQITLSIAGEDTMWSALCGAVGLPELASMTDAERSARRDEIVPRLREAVRQQPLAQLQARFEAARLAFGPVVSAQQVASLPHVAARGLVTEHAGQRHVRQPLLFDGRAAGIARGAPALGEHNHELLDQA